MESGDTGGHQRQCFYSGVVFRLVPGAEKRCQPTALLAQVQLADLTERGYDAELLVPEDDDIPLVERCSRANAIVSREGTDNVILVSIHTNAFGTAKNGLLPPVGASIRAKDKPEQTFSLMIWPGLP